MSARRVVFRLAGVAVLTAGAWCAALPAWAQADPPPAPPEHAGHDMSKMSHDGHDMASMAREGSGTSWLPDATPVYAFHASRGVWQLMAHENVFVQYLHESGDRGADQAGSINWFMGMAQRPLGLGRIGLRGMFSLEPLSIPGCGYPDLLASGEQCDGQQIHDRQHPHDLVMELSAQYDAPLARGIRWQVYGGPAAEPALGPVAFPHRLSAMPNPLAPIAHHWLDATHVAFGVVTSGLYGKQWKAEGSVFNGREPDEHRIGFDFGALDSVSARVSYLPIPTIALQVSIGRLAEAEAGEAGGPRVDVTRATASATVHAGVRDGNLWATTIAWGRNAEDGHATNALLVETNVTRHDRDTWFGRFETAGKTAHDLAINDALDDSEEPFTVAKLQGGYSRSLPARRGFAPGFGAAVSAGVVPEALRTAYGSRVNAGVAVFITVRPAASAR